MQGRPRRRGMCKTRQSPGPKALLTIRAPVLGPSSIAGPRQCSPRQVIKYDRWSPRWKATNQGLRAMRVARCCWKCRVGLETEGSSRTWNPSKPRKVLRARSRWPWRKPPRLVGNSPAIDFRELSGGHRPFTSNGSADGKRACASLANGCRASPVSATAPRSDPGARLGRDASRKWPRWAEQAFPERLPKSVSYWGFRARLG